MFELIGGRKIGVRAPCASVLKIYNDQRLVAYIDDLCQEDNVYISLIDEKKGNTRLSIIRAGHSEPNTDGEAPSQNYYLTQDRICVQITPFELYNGTFDKWESSCCVDLAYTYKNGEWVRVTQFS